MHHSKGYFIKIIKWLIKSPLLLNLANLVLTRLMTLGPSTLCNRFEFNTINGFKNKK